MLTITFAPRSDLQDAAHAGGEAAPPLAMSTPALTQGWHGRPQAQEAALKQNKRVGRDGWGGRK